MQLAPVLTRWATPWDHHGICVGMDGILRACGVDAEHVRRRMTAHAIVASGWRQAVWHHNAWGVKTGKSWTGDWYAMTTQEDDGSGNLYTVPNDAWRAFPNWRGAVADYQRRISPTSSRYAAAHAALVDPVAPDAAFWETLGAGGYYTDTQAMTPAKFASVCARVRNEVAAATPAEIDAAARVDVGTGFADMPAPSPAGVGLLVAVVVGIVLLLALGLD
jgi:hypothetical protein